MPDFAPRAAHMKTETQKTICRKDYRPPVFQVEHIEMGIDLDPAATVFQLGGYLASVAQPPSLKR